MRHFIILLFLSPIFAGICFWLGKESKRAPDENYQILENEIDYSLRHLKCCFDSNKNRASVKIPLKTAEVFYAGHDQ
jgi:hypothetical protein